MIRNLLTTFSSLSPIACALGVAIVGHQVAQLRQAAEEAEGKTFQHTKDIVALQSWRDRVEAQHAQGHHR